LCRLGNLEELTSLLEQLKHGAAPALAPLRPVERLAAPPRSQPPAPTAPAPNAAQESAPAKKKEVDEPLSGSVATAGAPASADDAGEYEPSPPGVDTPLEASALWHAVLARQSDMVRDVASSGRNAAIFAPNRLVITFPESYTRSYCERPEQLAKFEQALREVAGRPMRIEFVVQADEAKPIAAPTATPQQRMMQAAEHPLVRRANELFSIRPVRIEQPR
ncbi:MAG TPA: hypothetical protein VG713_00410, partial [Pirellulales bacterium]|nr:hypothetical protein [Pirellulales bacterium]